MAAWVAGILAILLVVVLVTIYAVLHTDSGRQYVLGIAQQKLTAAVGTQVKAHDFKVSFSGISPTLDLYNVVVDGANPYPTPPLLQADHIHAAVKVTSMVNRTWYLNDIQVDHPVIHVLVDAHGTDNLPETNTGSSQSQTNLFDLGVRHALIANGEVYYKKRAALGGQRRTAVAANRWFPPPALSTPALPRWEWSRWQTR